MKLTRLKQKISSFFKKNKWMKIFSIFLFLIIIGYFVLTSSWFITRVVLPSISRSLGVNITAEKCDFSLLNAQITFNNVYFTDDKKISVRFENMTVKSSLGSILRKKIHLKEVYLENSEIVYQRYKDSQLMLIEQHDFAGVLESEERRFNKITGLEPVQQMLDQEQITHLHKGIEDNGKKAVFLVAEVIAEKLKNIIIDSLELNNVDLSVKFINKQQNPTDINLKKLTLKITDFGLERDIKIVNHFDFSIYAKDVVNLRQAKVVSVINCYIEDDGMIRDFEIKSETNEVLGKVKDISLDKNIFSLSVKGKGVEEVFSLNEFSLKQLDIQNAIVSLITSSAQTNLDPFVGEFKFNIEKISPELMTITGVLLGNEVIGDCSPTYSGKITYSKNMITSEGDFSIKYKKSRNYPVIEGIENHLHSVYKILKYYENNINEVDFKAHYNLQIDPIDNSLEIVGFTAESKNNLKEKVNIELQENIKFDIFNLIKDTRLGRNVLDDFSSGAVRVKILNLKFGKLLECIVNDKNFAFLNDNVFSQIDLRIGDEDNLYFNIANILKNAKIKIGKEFFEAGDYQINLLGDLYSLDEFNIDVLRLSVNKQGDSLNLFNLDGKDGVFSIEENKLQLNSLTCNVHSEIIDFLPSRYAKDKITVNLQNLIASIKTGFVFFIDEGNIILSDLQFGCYDGYIDKYLFTAKKDKDFNLNIYARNNRQVIDGFAVHYAINEVPFKAFQNRFLKKKFNINEDALITSDGNLVYENNALNLNKVTKIDKVDKSIDNIHNKSKVSYSVPDGVIDIENSHFRINQEDIDFFLTGKGNLKNKQGDFNIVFNKLSDKIFTLLKKDFLNDKLTFELHGNSFIKFDLVKNDINLKNDFNVIKFNENDVSGNVKIDLLSTSTKEYFSFKNGYISLARNGQEILDFNIDGMYYTDKSKMSEINIDGKKVNIEDIVQLFGMNKDIIELSINDGEITESQVSKKMTKSLLDYLPDNEPKILDFKGLHLQVKGAIKEVIYRDINAQLVTEGKVKNNVVMLNDFEALFKGGGELAMDGTVDFGNVKGYCYRGSTTVNNLPLTNVMNSLLPTATKYSHGTLELLNFEVFGKGISKRNIKEYLKLSLGVNGYDFFIPNDYSNIRVYRVVFIPLEFISRLESSIPNIITFQNITKGFQDLSDATSNLNGFNFHTGELYVNFEDGIFTIEDLSLQGYLIQEVALLGTIDLYDREKLDLKALIRMPFLDFPFEIKGYLVEPKTIYHRTLEGILKKNTIKLFDSIKKSGDAGGFLLDIFK